MIRDREDLIGRVRTATGALLTSAFLMTLAPGSITEVHATYPAPRVTPIVTPEPANTPNPGPTLEPPKPVDVNDITAPEYQLVAVINSDRAAFGLKPVTMNAQLAKIAKIRSLQILSSGNMTHYADDGSFAFKSLLDQISFPYLSAGENLAQNNFYWEESMGMANIQLMNSPSHRRNILNPDFGEVGVGIVGPGQNQGQFGAFYYAQIFAQVK
jgi:uncharacterized protein YkwD